jgi:hypothetical protein
MSEFKKALECWDSIQPDIEVNIESTLENMFNNMPIKEMKTSIRKALRIADKLMQEPSDDDISCYIKYYE